MFHEDRDFWGFASDVVLGAVYSHVIRHVDMCGVCMFVSACVCLYVYMCLCVSVRTHCM